MSTTTPSVSTDSSGQAIQGTTGSSIGNKSVDQLGSTQFLTLMMTQLKYQDPANPTDPSAYLGELAQMSGVEAETNAAKASGQTASAVAVSSAVGLIGDTVTYIDQSTGKSTTGSVQSVQITSSGPTLTIDGVAGIPPSSVTAVTAGGSSQPAATGQAPATSQAPASSQAPATSAAPGPKVAS